MYFKELNQSIKWTEISATIMMYGSLFLQFEEQENKVILTYCAAPDGYAGQSKEYSYPNKKLINVINQIATFNLDISYDVDEDIYKSTSYVDNATLWYINFGNANNKIITIAGYSIDDPTLTCILDLLKTEFPFKDTFFE